MITLSLTDLERLMSMAIDAGIQAYERQRNPAGDNVKRGEAERLIKRYGFQPVMLMKWEAAGLITSHKSSNVQNAARWYSLTDIKRLIASLRVKALCEEANYSVRVK